MYLLMLLATFVSAIYGYNLSVRPDLDRDIPHKKAMAVSKKFLTQHNIAKNIAIRVSSGFYNGKKYIVDGDDGDDKKEEEGVNEAVPDIFPGDVIHSATDDEIGNEKNLEDITIVYRTGYHDDDDPLVIPLAKKGRLGQNIEDNKVKPLLKPGRYLIPAGEMVSRVICPDKEIDEDDVAVNCREGKAPVIGDDGAEISCCGQNKAPVYLVSYRTMDARWYNRLTNAVNRDFLWIFKDMEYQDNMGVVTWDDKEKQWNFQGKIKLYPVYHKDMEKAYEDHKNDNEPYLYPLDKIPRTNWKMPKKVFDRHFFQDLDGHDMCDGSGCLFLIQLL